MKRPWFAIIWFAVWGLFQAFAVSSVMTGRWERPEAFPKEAYESLIYPDLAFIPVYLLASLLLFMRHRFGGIVALVAGGGVLYALIYLFALSGFSGATNLIADSIFFVCTLIALSQAARYVAAA